MTDFLWNSCSFILLCQLPIQKRTDKDKRAGILKKIFVFPLVPYFYTTLFYLYNQDTQEIFEKYVINNQIIKKKLGQLKENIFKWTVNTNFIKRRSNFHGLVLKGMVEFSGFDMNANSSYQTSAPYFAGCIMFQIRNYS